MNNKAFYYLLNKHIPDKHKWGLILFLANEDDPFILLCEQDETLLDLCWNLDALIFEKLLSLYRKLI